MSNNPASPVVARIQPSALIFVVLILVVGALLLATNNLDPKASVRASLSATPIPPTLTFTPAPTLNPFTSTGYKQFQDLVLKIDYPDQWTASPDPQGRPSYSFGPGGGQNTNGVRVLVQVIPTSALAQSVPGVTAQSTPREILTLAVGQPQQGQAPIPVVDVKAGSLSGASFHQTNGVDQSGQPTNQELELWLLTLDPTHIAIIQANTPTGQWQGKLAPLFQHMMDSMVINVVAAVASPTPTSLSTGVATNGVTAAPRSAATAAK